MTSISLPVIFYRGKNAFARRWDFSMALGGSVSYFIATIYRVAAFEKSRLQILCLTCKFMEAHVTQTKRAIGN